MTDGPLLFAQDQEHAPVRVRRTTYYSLGGAPLILANVHGGVARAEVLEALRRLSVDGIAVMPGPAEVIRWTPPRRKRKKGWRYASEAAREDWSKRFTSMPVLRSTMWPAYLCSVENAWRTHLRDP